MQHLNSEFGLISHKMKHLIPRSTGAHGTTSSNETVIAGCEEQEDRVKISLM